VDTWLFATATNFDERKVRADRRSGPGELPPGLRGRRLSGYLSEKGSGVLAPHIRIPTGTPPVLLVHAGDDTMADAENKRGDVPGVEEGRRAGRKLHVYASGEHGFGVRKERPAMLHLDGSVRGLARGQGLLKP